MKRRTYVVICHSQCKFATFTGVCVASPVSRGTSRGIDAELQQRFTWVPSSGRVDALVFVRRTSVSCRLESL